MFFYSELDSSFYMRSKASFPAIKTIAAGASEKDQIFISNLAAIFRCYLYLSPKIKGSPKFFSFPTPLKKAHSR